MRPGTGPKNTLLLTDTNYGTILGLLLVSVHGNRAQKNEREESEEDKGHRRQQSSRLCPRRSPRQRHDEREKRKRCLPCCQPGTRYLFGQGTTRHVNTSPLIQTPETPHGSWRLTWLRRGQSTRHHISSPPLVPAVLLY